MYHLVSRYGNVHKETKDARKREELLRQGYVEAVPEKVPVPKKGKTQKTGNKEGEA